jgi:hypothetical protein
MNVYRRHVAGSSNPRRYDYTFAFRGTVGNKFPPSPGWLNNLRQTVSNSDRGQIQQAERLVDGIISNPNNNVRRVYFTGHSLGGYLSQWMEARMQEGDGVRGTSTMTGATTFNAPGLSQPLVGQGPHGTMTSHQLTVSHKIRNRSSYTNITNYRIAKRDGNLRV